MSTFYQKRLQERVQGKKILVFGLGLQGGGSRVANILFEQGAHVRVNDKKTQDELKESLAQLHPDIEVHVGEQTSEDTDWADIIIKNPGVPFTHPEILRALEKNTPVITETTLALQLARDHSIGITGTRGKTTTTTLIHHILHTAGLPVHLCGNIPHFPTLAAVVEAKENDWFVIEISSFHLESMAREKVSPHIAVITNVYPDHLDRYPSLRAYAETKAQLFAWQKTGDEAFWGTGHDWEKLLTKNVPKGVKGHAVSAPKVAAAAQEYPTVLQGQHNIRNVALATAVAENQGVSHTIIAQAVQSFTGVPYRQQFIRRVKDIEFINDTTATTPVALQMALEAQNTPFVLITGGATKKLPFTPELLTLLRNVPQEIFWLQGSGTTELLDIMYPQQRPRNLHLFTTLEEAVRKAYTFAQDKKIPRIVFSPGFTSFEMFKNEFHRGDVFNDLVHKLGE